MNIGKLHEHLTSLMANGVSPDTPVLKEVQLAGYEDIYEPSIDDEVFATFDDEEVLFSAVIL